MAKFRVTQFCSTAPGQPDWQVGDVLDLPADTPTKGHLERIEEAKKAPAKRTAKPKTETATADAAVETATDA